MMGKILINNSLMEVFGEKVIRILLSKIEHDAQAYPSLHER